MSVPEPSPDAVRTMVPEGADLGLGCGNPQAIAAMRAGETVLDLGNCVASAMVTAEKPA